MGLAESADERLGTRPKVKKVYRVEHRRRTREERGWGERGRITPGGGATATRSPPPGTQRLFHQREKGGKRHSCQGGGKKIRPVALTLAEFRREFLPLGREGEGGGGGGGGGKKRTTSTSANSTFSFSFRT